MEANPSEPSAAPAAPPKPAKSKGNPLTDLIESEKEYVDRLAGVIRKVAAAWSRSNFPPAELDAMFRAVEAVYRANRGFLSKLKEIGPNPASPKALGDLLMRWIEDLDAPYTRFCNTYSVGFDTWEPVTSNAALPPLLIGLSESHPPTPATSIPIDGSIPTNWTLDGLFALPRIRLKYYKKLYSRLLKSTQPGRSDHKLLVGANERLDGLLALAMSKLNVIVGEPEQDVTPAQGPPPNLEAPPSPPTRAEEGEPIRPLPPVPQPELPPLVENEPERRSVTSSIHQEPNGRVTSSLSGSSRSDRFSGGETGNDRLSRETAPTSVSAGSNGRPSPGRGSGTSPAPFSAPSSPPLPPTRSLFALQDALDTTQVLDIFSMKPKPCKLQLAQPVNPLPFDRIIKFEADVIISFTPKATGEEVVYEKAHIVMLTDLFLVCEWAIEEGRDTPTLFLCFPPLAARHLKVLDDPIDLGELSQNTFQVQVMRKETLNIRALSSDGKQRLARDFSRAVQEAINLAPPPRAPPQSGPSSAAQSPIGSPTMSQKIPPIMLPDNDTGPNGPSIGPRSPSTHSFQETTGNNGTMLSPRNSESGVIGQFSRMGLGGGSETNLPLSNELPPGPGGPGFGPQSRSPSFNNGPMPPPSPGFGPGGPGGPPGPGGFPRGTPGPPFPPGGPFPPGRHGPPGPPGMGPPGPGMGPPPPGPPDLHKSPSGRSMGSSRSLRPDDGPLPPLPGMPPQGFPPPGPYGPGPGGRPPFPPNMPPQGFPFLGGPPPGHLPPRSRSQPPPEGPDDFDSPPMSPVESNANAITGPTVISAQMKCKVFLKQQHAQWKSLGAAKLKLFKQEVPVLVKQLVVEADTKNKDLVISTIVLTDGVERVGRTGIAIELSDKGARTGIVYMLQLRNEAAATGLFNDLLAGSDRTGGRH